VRRELGAQLVRLLQRAHGVTKPKRQPPGARATSAAADVPSPLTGRLSDERGVVCLTLSRAPVHETRGRAWCEEHVRSTESEAGLTEASSSGPPGKSTSPFWPYPGPSACASQTIHIQPPAQSEDPHNAHSQRFSSPRLAARFCSSSSRGSCPPSRGSAHGRGPSARVGSTRSTRARLNRRALEYGVEALDQALETPSRLNLRCWGAGSCALELDLLSAASDLDGSEPHRLASCYTELLRRRGPAYFAIVLHFLEYRPESLRGWSCVDLPCSPCNANGRGSERGLIKQFLRGGDAIWGVGALTVF